MTDKWDGWDARYDAEIEAIDEMERQSHESGECKGPPYCAWCNAAIESGEESSGG